MNVIINQLIAIVIVFIIVYVLMELYFLNENRNLFNNAMRQIEIDTIKWDAKYLEVTNQGDYYDRMDSINKEDCV